MKDTVHGRAFARVALAGNPSDGYGGRTLAVTLRDFAAVASAEAAEQDELHEPGPGGAELMTAALARFRRHSGRTEAVTLRCRTNVPREVGLGGSSAIVIACVRALCALHGTRIDPDELARLALAAEAEDLGIAAGLQDRVVQARETLVSMDFAAEPSFEELDPALLPPLFVAWHPDAAAPSGVAHGALRQRHAEGDEEVVGALTRLAGLARDARDALLDGRHDAFAASLDASFDERLRIMTVDAHTAEMVQLARASGATANSAGSGGAIVGTIREERGWADLRRSLEAAGASVMRPQVGGAGRAL